MLNSGDLNRPIQIQINNPVRDDYGQLIDNWTTYKSLVWADYKEKGQSEFQTAGLEVGFRLADFTIRFDNTINTAMRIVYNNLYWDIESIKEVGFGEGLILQAKANDYDVVSVPVWLLSGGVWNDSGVWIDTEFWEDA